ncbi:MAG: IreB family regulatory phosphoprotein [Clostridia bacterium]|nr:IreB family regulatory phosphoprotein [Clostridia bacterium]
MGGDETRVLGGRGEAGGGSPREALFYIYQALREKGYDPVRQIAYFLLSGEPTYITAHKNARSVAARLDRDEIVEELVRHYLGTGERRE